MKRLVLFTALGVLLGCANNPTNNSTTPANNSSNPSSPTNEVLSVSNFIYTNQNLNNGDYFFSGSFEAAINPPLPDGTLVTFSVNPGLSGQVFEGTENGGLFEVTMSADISNYFLTSNGCLDNSTQTVTAYANGQTLGGASVAVGCNNGDDLRVHGWQLGRSR